MGLPRTPALMTDCVVIDPKGRVIIIRRKHDPFAGCHALPGGFVEVGETVEAACRREVLEETSLKVSDLTLVGVYSDPKRDPRGHTVSVAYTTTLPDTVHPRRDRTRRAPNGSRTGEVSRLPSTTRKSLLMPSI